MEERMIEGGTRRRSACRSARAAGRSATRKSRASTSAARPRCARGAPTATSTMRWHSRGRRRTRAPRCRCSKPPRSAFESEENHHGKAQRLPLFGRSARPDERGEEARLGRPGGARPDERGEEAPPPRSLTGRAKAVSQAAFGGDQQGRGPHRDQARLRLWGAGEPRDLWIGVYWHKKDESLFVYICFVPLLPIRIHYKRSYGGRYV
jgi:hypothetical protein